jgi:hypothetical protein
MANQVKGYSVELTDNKGPSWERKENPQSYDQFAFAYVHKNAGRHILGVVGGNEVSLIKGNVVDLESDLRGLNIPNTFCPERKYQPPSFKDGKIQRSNVKIKLDIDTRPVHLPAYQMWAYPAIAGPELLRTDSCGTPERY